MTAEEDLKNRLGETFEKVTKGKITKDMISETFDEAKANIARLKGCTGPHDFKVIPEADGYKRYREVCSKCGGEIGGQQATWYRLGLAHAKTNL